MKKKLNIAALILFISLLPMTIFSSCDKDTNCYLDVLVLEEGTRAPVSGAKIIINQEGGSVYAVGITEANGKFSTYFNAPAILNVNAELLVDVENNGYRRGSTTVRIIEGESKTAIVTLAQQIQYN
jgi:hypothetical protein